jgi:acyl carrier protein
MTDQEIIERINTTIAKEFELEPAVMKPEAHLVNDLGLDSLDFVDLVVVLQNAFAFKLREDKAIREVRTLGQIHELVLQKKRELEARQP